MCLSLDEPAAEGRGRAGILNRGGSIAVELTYPTSCIKLNLLIQVV